MIYEWRTYEAMPGKFPALHTHLKVAADLFQKHGLGVLGFWTEEIGLPRFEIEENAGGFGRGLVQAPGADFRPLFPAVADGVLPDGFFSTTNLPTYVKVGGAWRRPRLPRMDCVLVQLAGGDLLTTEPRKVRRGDLVAVGKAEDGSEGIFVHAEGFLGGGHSANEFRFMQTEVSREKPVDYSLLAELLGEEKQRGGRILWVIGPALVHARAREDMIWFIENGYVGTLLGGNAVAVHDLEAAIFGTTLGMSSTGEGVEGGHALHMRAINAIRRAGSIEAAVRSGLVRSGIMHALVTHNIPYVLAGSIRDDGPLPDTEMDLIKAQEEYARLLDGAKMVICLSSMLHSIGAGNMTPSWVRMVCVDINPAVVTKLSDRGSQQTIGVVTDVGTFLNMLAQQLWV